MDNSLKSANEIIANSPAAVRGVKEVLIELDWLMKDTYDKSGNFVLPSGEVLQFNFNFGIIFF